MITVSLITCSASLLVIVLHFVCTFNSVFDVLFVFRDAHCILFNTIHYVIIRLKAYLDVFFT